MMNLTLAIVTALSLIVAAIMTLVAWVTVRDERRRAAARVAVLSAAIHQHDELPLGRPVEDASPRLLVKPSRSLGAWVASGSVVTACAVVAIAGLVIVAEGRSRPRPQSGATHAVRVAEMPLELLTLEHDRDDNRLVVRGIVRNPSSAAAIKGLTAVVLVFSKDGKFIATGRAPAAVASLAAGAETPFVVTLPDADSIDRFRVSFRSEDRVVAHVDRRRNAIARTE